MGFDLFTIMIPPMRPPHTDLKMNGMKIHIDAMVMMLMMV